MKINISTWQPFFHENFEYKQKVIEIARKRDPNKLEDVLTAILIYINAVDYIASHLLKNLKEMKYLILHNEFDGSIFEDYEDNSRGLPLGKIINYISKYEFPDKAEFINELGNFNSLRVRYVHKFLEISPSDLEKMGLEIDQIYKLAESILVRYDILVKAITGQWYLYLQKKVQPPQIGKK